jgi:Tol biopolymer transport system component
VALVSTGALAWKYFQPGDAPASAVRFHIPLPPKTPGLVPGLGAFSADGRYLAFAVGGGPTLPSQLWIRPLDSTNERLVPGTGDAAFPFWSPDGRFIAFWTSLGLQKIPVEGGSAITLTTAHPFGGTWNRDGVILIGSDSGPILRVAESGGDAVPALALDKSRQETSQLWPQFLPDGRRFLYLSRAQNGGGVFLGELGSKQSRRVIDSEAQGLYAAGHVFFVRAQSLLAQRFDLSSGAVTGAPFPVADKIGYVPEIASAAYTVSLAGSLAYRAGVDVASVIEILNRRGERTGVAGPSGDYAQLTLSPDEKRLAIDRREKGNFDIWMLELGTGVFSRVTFDPGNDRDPVFSPDGRQIVFTNNRLGMPHLYRKTVGGGPEELIYRGPDREASEAWLKDGSILFGNLGGHKYFLLRPGEREPKLIYQSDFQVDEPAISPDGKWVAYGSRESGTWQAYVARFPEWDEQRQISTDGGMQPHWRADGREIVYVTSDGKLMSVGVKPGTSFEASPPALLFNTGLRASGTLEQWTMSHDASRFYVLTSVQEGETPITVALNWLPTARK